MWMLFWEQFWEPQKEGLGWQQPLVLLPRSLWVWGVWGRLGGGWISTQGGHSTFHLPKSLHTSLLWLLQLRSEERGKALWAGHVMGRAQSHLCSCLSCTVATSSSRASLLSVSKLLHMLALPCSISGAATLPGWGAEFLCACSSSARSPRMTRLYVHLCFWRPHASAALERI